MAYTFKLFFFTVSLALSMASMAVSRPLGTIPSLGARLKLDGESPNCWDSLIQLYACSGEVILFFLNGETYLGPGCCQAIRFIGHQCWPEMFGSLGFTTEEGDILQGYCDAAVHFPPPSASPPWVEPTKIMKPEILVP